MDNNVTVEPHALRPKGCAGCLNKWRTIETGGEINCLFIIFGVSRNSIWFE